MPLASDTTFALRRHVTRDATRARLRAHYHRRPQWSTRPVATCHLLRLWAFALGVLLTANNSAAGDQFSAKVIKVLDGDSITVLRDRTPIDVRLDGIDCPELGQPYGRSAKQFTSNLAFGKTVHVEDTGQDRYGRTLARVVLPDGRRLNEEVVSAGYAWWYQAVSKDQHLRLLEADAQSRRRGLWQDPRPVPPWDWRKQGSATAKSAETIVIQPIGVVIVGLLPDPVGPDEGHEMVILENTTDHVMRLDGWRLMDRARNVFRLPAGTAIEPGKELVIIMAEPTMPLNNTGDNITLLDSKGIPRSHVSYDQPLVKAGRAIQFPGETSR